MKLRKNFIMHVYIPKIGKNFKTKHRHIICRCLGEIFFCVVKHCKRSKIGLRKKDGIPFPLNKTNSKVFLRRKRVIPCQYWWWKCDNNSQRHNSMHLLYVSMCHIKEICHSDNQFAARSDKERQVTLHYIVHP